MAAADDVPAIGNKASLFQPTLPALRDPTYVLAPEQGVRSIIHVLHSPCPAAAEPREFQVPHRACEIQPSTPCRWFDHDEANIPVKVRPNVSPLMK